MMFTVKRLTTSPPPGVQSPTQSSMKYLMSPPFGMFEKPTANYSNTAINKPLPGRPSQPSLNLLFEAARKKKKVPQKGPQKSAIVAASWDPPTLGHVWLVKKAAQFFDKVWVVLAANPDKTSSFTQDDRLEMIQGSLEDVPNTEVVTLQNEFLVEFAKKKKASALVRGIRNTMDFEYEKTMARANQAAVPDIQTVFFVPPKELEDLSSSFVRGLIGTLNWRQWVAPLVTPVVFEKLKEKAMQKRWDKLTEKLGIPASVSKETFKALIKSYSEPTRFYHTKDHLIDCFEVLDTYLNDSTTQKPQHPEMLELALWFHDVVDERGNPQGVDQSAEKALAYLEKSSSPHLEAWKKALQGNIMSTKHFSPENAPVTFDSKLMVDIDLSVLGKPWKNYQAYIKAIRQEYQEAPDALYKPRRSQVMKTFLERSPLYYTPWMQETYGPQAKRNLKREIATLEKDH